MVSSILPGAPGGPRGAGSGPFERLLPSSQGGPLRGQRRWQRPSEQLPSNQAQESQTVDGAGGDGGGEGGDVSSVTGNSVAFPRTHVCAA